MESRSNPVQNILEFYRQSISRNIEEVFDKCLYQHSQQNYVTLNPQQFQALLQSFYGMLKDLMYNSHQLNRFHQNSQNIEEGLDDMQTGFIDYFTKINKEYLQSRQQMVYMMEIKIGSIIKTYPQFCQMDSNQIKQLLISVNLFLQTAEQFTMQPSKDLKDCIKQQCKKYLQYQEEKNLFNMKSIIKNDDLRRLPVSSQYKHQPLLNLLNSVDPSINSQKMATLLDSDSQSNGFLQLVNQFEDQDSQLDCSYIVHDDHPFEREPPKSHIYQQNRLVQYNYPGSETVVNQAAIFLLKYFESMLNLVDILRPISFDVFLSLKTAFDYFLYCLYYKFTSHKLFQKVFRDIEYPREVSLNQYCDYYSFQEFKLKYRNIKQYLIQLSDLFNNYQPKYFDQQDPLHQSVNMNQQSSCESLLIALDSLSFINHNFNLLQPLILQILSDPSITSLVNKYFSDYQIIVSQYQSMLISDHCSQMLTNQSYLQNIKTMKWEYSPNQSLQNIYPDRIYNFIRNLNDKLDCSHIPLPSLQTYIQSTIHQVLLELIEQYSQIKKCNHWGRLQMSKDVAQFISQLQSFLQLSESNLKVLDILNNFILCTSDSSELVDFLIHNIQFINVQQSTNLIRTMAMAHKLNEKEVFSLYLNRLNVTPYFKQK